MPRPLRECLEEMTYECTSKCHNLSCHFSLETMTEAAELAIIKAQGKYTFEVILAEFVENHFHIIIKTASGGETISRIMQYIKSRIAEHFNRTTGRSGAFWNQRFKSKIIEKLINPVNYLLISMWHIAYNPVRRGLLSNPRDSKKGTFLTYLEETFKPRINITFHEYFLNLGESFKERAARFLEYEELYLRLH